MQYSVLPLTFRPPIFLPVFGVDTDNNAVQTAKHIFHKAIVPVNINEIAADGGLLNCISWET